MREKGPATAQNSVGVRGTNTMLDKDAVPIGQATHNLRVNLAQEEAAAAHKAAGGDISDYLDGWKKDATSDVGKDPRLEASKPAAKPTDASMPNDTKVPLAVRLGTLPQELEWFVTRHPELTKFASKAAGGAATGAGMLAAVYELVKYLEGKSKDDAR